MVQLAQPILIGRITGYLSGDDSISPWLAYSCAALIPLLLFISSVTCNYGVQVGGRFVSAKMKAVCSKMVYEKVRVFIQVQIISNLLPNIVGMFYLFPDIFINAKEIIFNIFKGE